MLFLRFERFWRSTKADCLGGGDFDLDYKLCYNCGLCLVFRHAV